MILLSSLALIGHNGPGYGKCGIFKSLSCPSTLILFSWNFFISKQSACICYSRCCAFGFLFFNVVCHGKIYKLKRAIWLVLFQCFFCISFMMNLCLTSTTVDTFPIVSFENDISFSLSIIWFQIYVSIIIPPPFTLYVKNPALK